MAMVGSWSAQDFPNLTDQDYIETSPLTRRYNCIAWSVGNTADRWWPDPWGVGRWPQSVSREVTIDGFIRMFEALGYVECGADGSYEQGLEKVALYAKPGIAGQDIPTHAAIQLESGKWSSKLGDFEDIEHADVSVLNGPQYGRVVCYLKRIRLPRPRPPSH
jgi:hypothetical protein